MPFDSIKAILANSRFHELIGLDEDIWLEAKGRNPYDLETPMGRYELAKDVSAFANAEGGFLIVGLTTAIVPDAITERITEHDLCPQADFDGLQYLGIIREHVYPAIKDLKAYWLPVNEPATHGLGIVEVPAQSANNKYFLISKVIESGASLKQIVFGIAKRNESSNIPFTVAELYKYTQSGKHSVPQALARVEEKLDRLIETQMQPNRAAIDPEQIYAERAARILENEDPQ